MFFRKTFGYFRKNTSSGNFPEKVLPELPEEPLTGLPEDSVVSLLRHFFRRPLVFSPLVFYPKVTILRFHCYANNAAYYKQRVGRLTCSRRRRRKPCLGRASRRRRKFTKKIRRTNQVHGRGREDEAVRINSVFREVIRVFYNFILKGKMVVSINCWVHQQYCWMHLAFPPRLEAQLGLLWY